MATALETTDVLYQCPGESYSISREVHLGRLASFYARCRECPHRDDTGLLSATQKRHLAEMWRRGGPPDVFVAEGLEGTYHNELSASVVRRAALAFAVQLWQEADGQCPAAVILAGDGRPQSIELAAAAGEGLRMAGCDLVELGRATAASLCAAIYRLDAGGGLFVGNPGGQSHRAGLKFWSRGARPLSSPGRLDRLRELFHAAADRPSRRCGTVRRGEIDEDYLAPLRDSFHALRPLRVALDIASQPLEDFLRTLAGQGIGVTFEAATLPAGAAQASIHGHLGAWIDGDGEMLRLFDERGAAVAGEKLLAAFVRSARPHSPALSIVVERESDAAVVQQIAQCGARPILSGSTREEMHQAMCQQRAVLGGGPSGRFWFGPDMPAADALRTLAEVLVMLSQSDRTASSAINGEKQMGNGESGRRNGECGMGNGE